MQMHGKHPLNVKGNANHRLQQTLEEMKNYFHRQLPQIDVLLKASRDKYQPAHALAKEQDKEIMNKTPNNLFKMFEVSSQNEEVSEKVKRQRQKKQSRAYEKSLGIQAKMLQSLRLKAIQKAERFSSESKPMQSRRYNVRRCIEFETPQIEERPPKTRKMSLMETSHKAHIQNRQFQSQRERSEIQSQINGNHSHPKESIMNLNMNEHGRLVQFQDQTTHSQENEQMKEIYREILKLQQEIQIKLALSRSQTNRARKLQIRNQISNIVGRINCLKQTIGWDSNPTNV